MLGGSCTMEELKFCLALTFTIFGFKSLNTRGGGSGAEKYSKLLSILLLELG